MGGLAVLFDTTYSVLQRLINLERVAVTATQTQHLPLRLDELLVAVARNRGWGERERDKGDDGCHENGGPKEAG